MEFPWVPSLSLLLGVLLRKSWASSNLNVILVQKRTWSAITWLYKQNNKKYPLGRVKGGKTEESIRILWIWD